MKQRDRQVETLLAAARGRDEAPAAARARVKSAVASSIALSAAAAGASTVILGSASSAVAKLPAAVHAASTLLPAASVVAPPSSLVALGPIAVGVALGLSAISPSEVAPQAPVVAKSPSAPAPERTRSLEVKGRQLLAPVATGAPSAGPSAVPGARSAELLPNISEEASLLEHARLVLRQGDPELTLRLLDRLRRDFPQGALFYESLATRAVALCRVGRSDEALQILARIEAIAPRSGLIVEVRRACHATTDSVEIEGVP